MKSLLFTGLLCCFLPAAGQQWTKIGPTGFHTGTTYFVSMAVDAVGTPYISYKNYYNQVPYIMKFDGNTWTNLPWYGLSTSNATHWNIPLVFDANNLPNVAFSGCSPACFSLVKTFQGNAWYTVGDSTMNPGWDEFLCLAIGPNNVRFVGYNIYPDKLSVIKNSGSNIWMQVGVPEFANGRFYQEALAVDGNGTPYVVVERTGDNKLTVYKFDGSNWVTVGTPGFSVSNTYMSSLAISKSGIPYVAYIDGVTQKPIVVKFDGTNWVTVGTPSFNPNLIKAISFKLDPNDVPVILMQEITNGHKASVMKFTGNSWQYAGNPQFTDTAAYYPSLAIAPDGTLYCASVNNNNPGWASVWKYTGSTGLAYYNEEVKQISVSPNPAVDEVLIMASEIRGDVEISLYNVRGQRVKQVQARIMNSESISLSLQGLLSGTYFLLLKQHDKTITTILVKS